MDLKTLVVVPTYNERDNLPNLVKKVAAQPLKLELLIVDDNSPDGTGAIADELASERANVAVLHRAASLHDSFLT